MPMPKLSSELAEALAELDRSPQQGALRLRAAVLANRLAATVGDPFLADVAEAVASEPAPGATPALRASLAEQVNVARQLRRAGHAAGRQDVAPTQSPNIDGASA